jgi:hypothetical protein
MGLWAKMWISEIKLFFTSGSSYLQWYLYLTKLFSNMSYPVGGHLSKISHSDSNRFGMCWTWQKALNFQPLVCANPSTHVQVPILEFFCKFRPPTGLRTKRTITAECGCVARVLEVGENVAPDRLRPLCPLGTTEPIEVNRRANGSEDGLRIRTYVGTYILATFFTACLPCLPAAIHFFFLLAAMRWPVVYLVAAVLRNCCTGTLNHPSVSPIRSHLYHTLRYPAIRYRYH